VNVALWLKAVAEPSQPRENECHIRTRLTQLVPDPGEVDRVLTESSDLDEDERGRRFRRILDEQLTPLLAATGSLAELRANRPGFLDQFLLGAEALPLLNAE